MHSKTWRWPAWPSPRLSLRLRACAFLLTWWAFQAPVAVAQDTLPQCPPAAQAPTPEQMASGMRSARDRGFLWRVSKGGRTSYLYGTLHVAKADWVYPGPTVLRAIVASDRVALELDMLDPEVLQKLSSGMAAPSFPLPEALEARLQAQAGKACVPMQSLSTLPPEMQAITLSVMAGRADGIDPSYAIDVFLAGFARGMKKAVVSLETPESQLKLMRGESEAETIAVVEKSLSELESGRARGMIRRIADMWAGGRIDELQRYEQWCECVGTEEDRRAMHRLLDQRNPALAEGIARLHEGGQSVFAAVGSLHMIGAAGLPALLAQRGYRVERIEFPR